jgi:hypothetical protein
MLLGQNQVLFQLSKAIKMLLLFETHKKVLVLGPKIAKNL